MSNSDLNYASLAVDTEIVSSCTGEHAIIRSLTDSLGFISVKLVSGSDAGEYQSVHSIELIKYWHKA